MIDSSKPSIDVSIESQGLFMYHGNGLAFINDESEIVSDFEAVGTVFQQDVLNLFLTVQWNMGEEEVVM